VWLADAWSLVLLVGLWFDDIFLRLLLEWFWWVAVLRVEADGASSLLAWHGALFWVRLSPLMVGLLISLMLLGFGSPG
jgi:hypothetical protein